MRHILCGFVLALASAAFGQTASVADRVAKQNALFEEFYQTGLKNSPERATSYGDYRYNAQLDQYSLAEIARQHAEADDFLKRLQAIPIDGMSDKDVLSHQTMERQLQREDVNYSLKNYEMPVNQQNGLHTRLADLPLRVPLDSVTTKAFRVITCRLASPRHCRTCRNFGCTAFTLPMPKVGRCMQKS